MGKIKKLKNGNFKAVHGKTGKELNNQPRDGFKSRCDAQLRLRGAVAKSFGTKSPKTRKVPVCDKHKDLPKTTERA